MAEAVTGAEIKVRVGETPELDVANLLPDHRLLLDSPTSGPGNASTSVVVGDGVARLPVSIIPPGGLPAGSTPKIPAVVGETTSLFDGPSLFANGISFYLGPKQFPPITNNQGGALVPGNTSET